MRNRATVTPAVAFETPVAVAAIVVDPFETAATGTETLAEFGPNPTVPGTVATPGFVELRVTDRPLADAGVDRFSVRFCVPVPLMVRLAGEKLMVTGVAPPGVTCTCTLAELKPYGEAVMVADPGFTPVTVGVSDGQSIPAK